MMDKSVEKMKNRTDLFPWYWYAYGEKCYAFAVVEAITETESATYPEPGSMLTPVEEDAQVWVGENGTRMLIQNEVASVEEQRGDILCEFIAQAHAHFMREAIAEYSVLPETLPNPSAATICLQADNERLAEENKQLQADIRALSTERKEQCTSCSRMAAEWVDPDWAKGRICLDCEKRLQPPADECTCLPLPEPPADNCPVHGIVGGA